MVTRNSGGGQRAAASGVAAVLLGIVGLVLVMTGAPRPPAGATATSHVPVLTTARAVAAGALIAADDVTVTHAVAPLTAVGPFLQSADDAVGRRAAVALPAGIPVLAVLLLARDAPMPGHRLIRLQVDAGALPPDVDADQIVEVLAALPDAQSGGGRLVTVATAQLVSIVRPDGLVLDVDAASAGRLLWAEAFAKSLRVLARPVGDTAPSPVDVTGLGR